MIAGSLLLAGVVPRASAGVATSAGAPASPWPYPSRLCPPTAAPAPTAFGPPETLGGDEHTNVTAVAFGRLGDRQVAVSTGAEGTMRVWSLPKLTPIGEPVRAKTIVSGEFDGQPLVVPEPLAPTGLLNGRRVRVTAGDELRVTDVATGREVGPDIYLGEDNTVHALVLVTLGGRLTAVVNDNGGDEMDPGPDYVRFWDLATGEKIDTIEGAFSAVAKATVGGRTVLLTVNNGENRWDLGTDYAPDGSVTIWDPATRTQIRTLPGNPPTFGPEAYGHRNVYDRTALATTTLDGRPVALTGGGDNTLRLWDLTTGKAMAATEPVGHQDQVAALGTGELNGRPVLASSSWDGRVLLWDLATRSRIGPALTSPPGDKFPISVPHGPPLIQMPTGGFGFGFWQFDDDGTLVHVRSEPGSTRPVEFDGRPALITEESGGLRLHDLATGKPIGARIPITGQQPVSRARLTDLDGGPVMIDIRRRIRIWDLYSGRRLGAIPDVHAGEADPDLGRVRCTTAVLTATENAGHVWDLRTGHEITPPLTGHTGRIFMIRYGVLGALPIAVTAARDRTIRIWNLEDGHQIGPAITAGLWAAFELAYVNGHTLLLRGGNGERILVWDLSTTR
ncbi:WD40 repeat domain-containing protein [Acrocarpospora catenulata]|uniref:WD40 repeat domain-containing protein n=1 Tax=Acrocarpospora catenulata TaxID=2836182 RepID=UPI001BDAA835|nr:WD40 repeat domain-containing protein [Acrocarpospora catenulata]